MDEQARRRYLVLPARGTRVDSETPPSAARMLLSLEAGRSLRLGVRSCHVLDRVCADGVRLVEMTPQAALQMRGREPGLRVLPEIFYRPALAPRRRPVKAPLWPAASTRAMLAFALVVRGTGAPLGRAEVVAFRDYAGGEGVVTRSDARGRVRLPWRTGKTVLDALFVYPVGAGSWGYSGRKVALETGGRLEVEPLDPAVPDGLRQRYGVAPLGAGEGVTVGIVDTGVGPHPDLVVDGGRNTVWREAPSEIQDSGAGHGTHVAGIVGAGARGRGAARARARGEAALLPRVRTPEARGGGPRREQLQHPEGRRPGRA